MNKQQKKPVNWKENKVRDIFDFIRTYAFSREALTGGMENEDVVGNIHYGDIHATYKSTNIDLERTCVPMVISQNFEPKQEDLLKGGDIVMADVSEDYEGVGAYITIHNLKNKKITGGLHTFVLRDKSNNTDEYYRQYIFRHPYIKRELKKIATGVSVFGISKNNLGKLFIILPTLLEQGYIVRILETWDKYLKALDKKINIKKNVKKGLLQSLTTGKIRLNGFSNDWETIELGGALKYEQPWKCIVKSDNYDNSYTIPVLTANKSFVLGYTNENYGIYQDIPVIIFDDFTTLNKYVDFPFKVKSSAIKILKPKNNNFNLKFLFERIQLIPYVVGEHKRCYISEYQYFDIKIPEIEEQNAIANVLIIADKEIETLERQREIVINQKKYLLNNLITGQIRLPEFV